MTAPFSLTEVRRLLDVYKASGQQFDLVPLGSYLMAHMEDAVALLERVEELDVALSNELNALRSLRDERDCRQRAERACRELADKRVELERRLACADDIIRETQSTREIVERQRDALREKLSAAEEEIVEAQSERDEAQSHAQALEDGVNDLRAALAAAEKDTARLDWLEQNGLAVGLWDTPDESPWAVVDSLDASAACLADGESIRAAIDASIADAMADDARTTDGREEGK